MLARLSHSDDIVVQDDDKTVKLEIKFIHPMEGHYMEMVKPKQFGVMHRGKRDDLLASLQETKGKSADQDKGVDSLGPYLRYEVGACGPNKIIPAPSALWGGIGFSLMKIKKSRSP